MVQKCRLCSVELDLQIFLNLRAYSRELYAAPEYFINSLSLDVGRVVERRHDLSGCYAVLREVA